MSLFYRNCREVTRLVLERENRRLTLVERIAVRLHLRICLMCTRFTGQLQLMNRAMAQWKHYAEHDERDDAAT
ncbi:MAG TPA: zf-HC2 domain-containing protein [Burkholderiaceae bacterium]